MALRYMASVLVLFASIFLGAGQIAGEGKAERPAESDFAIPGLGMLDLYGTYHRSANRFSALIQDIEIRAIGKEPAPLLTGDLAQDRLLLQMLAGLGGSGE